MYVYVKKLDKLNNKGSIMINMYTCTIYVNVHIYYVLCIVYIQFYAFLQYL